MALTRKILEQVLGASAEPLVIVQIDRPDWPVVLSNSAFDAIGGEDARQRPFADVVEQLVGRDRAWAFGRHSSETTFGHLVTCLNCHPYLRMVPFYGAAIVPPAAG